MRLMKTPRDMEIEITGRCNLRCRYCSHFSSDGDVEEDLWGEEWLMFFEELGRCTVLSVCLQGGEPFMRNDLESLIAGIVRNRMRFSILTNGTLITDEIAAFLASTGRCDYVQVSIDGSVPATHDACRGEGAFHRAITGLKILLKHQVPAAVRVTIHRQNVEDLDGIAAMLLEEIGLPSFSTNSAGHLGLCRANKNQTQLTVEEQSLAMESLLRLAEKYNGRISATAGPLAQARGWGDMERARRQGIKSFPNGGYLTGCGGSMTKLAVKADGTLVPCAYLSRMELGRINNDDLREIWQDHPELNRLRKRSAIPLESFEYCRDCRYKPYCTGNCPALADSILGDPYHPSPDSCYRRFLAAGGVLPREVLMADSGP